LSVAVGDGRRREAGERRWRGRLVPSADGESAAISVIHGLECLQLWNSSYGNRHAFMLVEPVTEWWKRDPNRWRAAGARREDI
jgi:hypothetical protein